jgi:hypothetical protein
MSLVCLGIVGLLSVEQLLEGILEVVRFVAGHRRLRFRHRRNNIQLLVRDDKIGDSVLDVSV